MKRQMNWVFNSEIQPTVAFILRLTVSVVMFAHGAQKMFGWFGGRGWDASIAGMEKTAGLPLWFAAFVIFCETFGMLFLLLGFLTKFWSTMIVCIMIGAIINVAAPNGFFMNWATKPKELGGGEGFEFHLLMIGLCWALIVAGGGKWSVDSWISDRLKSKSK